MAIHSTKVSVISMRVSQSGPCFQRRFENSQVQYDEGYVKERTMFWITMWCQLWI